MTGHKQIEQSLKKPDLLQDKVVHFLQSLRTNRKQVFMLVAPVVAVIVVGYGINGYLNHRSTARRASLAKIMALQTEEQNSIGKQRDDIQKQIDELRTNKSKADGKKSEVSPDALAKITQLESQLSSLKPDTSKSTAEFKSFYDANKKNVEGWMAGLSWASRKLQDRKLDEARPVVEQIAKASISNKFYQLNSRFMMIGILEETGDFEAALKECEILSGIAGDDAKPTILLTKGRLEYFKKDLEAAKKTLTELAEKHASAPEATKARGLMSLL